MTIEEECPEMARVRSELVRRGIAYQEDNETRIMPCGYVRRTLQTKWESCGHIVNVIWGYSENPSERNRYPVSYGFNRNRLECWYEIGNRGPYAMTAEEIICRFM